MAAAFLLAGGSAVLLEGQDISHRQGHLAVTIRDAAGNRLPDAEVHIEMVNPSFRWGTAAPVSALTQPQWRQALERYFNSITFENEMKWDAYARSGGNPTNVFNAIELVRSIPAFGASGQFRIRGHATVWASGQVPPAIRNMIQGGDAANLRPAVRAHIVDYHSDFAPYRLDTFDFYNEPWNQRGLANTLTPNSSFEAPSEAEIAEVVEWFQLARETDPDAVLFVNEYNILNDWTPDHQRVRHYKNYIDRLRDAGAPIGGIGVQSHLDRRVTYEQFKERLGILTAPTPGGLPGVRVEITELDINPEQPHPRNGGGWYGSLPYPTPEEQADMIADLIRAAFETPGVEGVTVWGIADDRHWRGNAVLYDATGHLKPGGRTWIDLVRGEYWTSAGGRTDADGRFDAVIFKGTHRVSVRHGDTVRSFEIDAQSDAEVELTLAPPPAVLTYADWLDNRFLTSIEQVSRAEDPDGDGMSNLLEFLFGSDPMSPATTYPEISADETGVVLSYRLRKASAEQTTVTVRVSQLDHAFNTAFGSWTTLFSAEPVQIGEEAGFYQYQIRIGWTGNQKRAYRLDFNYSGE